MKSKAQITRVLSFAIPSDFVIMSVPVRLIHPRYRSENTGGVYPYYFEHDEDMVIP